MAVGIRDQNQGQGGRVAPHRDIRIEPPAVGKGEIEQNGIEPGMKSPLQRVGETPDMGNRTGNGTLPQRLLNQFRIRDASYNFV